MYIEQKSYICDDENPYIKFFTDVPDDSKLHINILEAYFRAKYKTKKFYINLSRKHLVFHLSAVLYLKKKQQKNTFFRGS